MRKVLFRAVLKAMARERSWALRLPLARVGSKRGRAQTRVAME
jgi:hypothetical protein